MRLDDDKSTELGGYWNGEDGRYLIVESLRRNPDGRLYIRHTIGLGMRAGPIRKIIDDDGAKVFLVSRATHNVSGHHYTEQEANTLLATTPAVK